MMFLQEPPHGDGASGSVPLPCVCFIMRSYWSLCTIVRDSKFNDLFDTSLVVIGQEQWDNGGWFSYLEMKVLARRSEAQPKLSFQIWKLPSRQCLTVFFILCTILFQSWYLVVTLTCCLRLSLVAFSAFPQRSFFFQLLGSPVRIPYDHVKVCRAFLYERKT